MTLKVSVSLIDISKTDSFGHHVGLISTDHERGWNRVNWPPKGDSKADVSSVRESGDSGLRPLIRSDRLLNASNVSFESPYSGQFTLYHLIWSKLIKLFSRRMQPGGAGHSFFIFAGKWQLIARDRDFIDNGEVILHEEARLCSCFE